ncbi:MAG: four helix bundle protein [Rhizonema sp. NSF051]|nr:four helix bundle protein [Rhizonema sp. NSF051]
MRFVSIALGSLAELETQVMLAGKLGYLSETQLQPLLFQTGEIHKMLRGIQKVLKAKV